MIRIHFTYRHIDGPWGGANNFIRALREDLVRSGRFDLTPSAEDCELLFMNQLGTGPGGAGQMISLREVRSWLGRNGSRNARRRLVVRAVNLNRHAFRLGPRNLTLGWWRDRQTIALLNMADAVVFQSAYQRGFFREAGYSGTNDVIIHNGASPRFWADPPQHLPVRTKLRLVSSTASPRETKRHDLIAKFSLQDNVEILHIGAWPKGLSTARVQLLGTKTHDEMLQIMSSCHYLLHPAIKDPCPNSVFEAVCAGLPVIYNPGPGSSREILGDCGLALDESHPDVTMALSHDRLHELRSRVLARRHEFAIGWAASRYRQKLEEVAQTEEAAA